MSMWDKNLIKPLAVAGWAYCIDDYYTFGGSMDTYAIKTSGSFGLLSAIAVAVAQSFAQIVASSATGVKSSPLSNG